MTMRPWEEGPLRPSHLLAMAAFIASIHLAWWLQDDSIAAIGDLLDGDSYARLVRVTHLYETGGWFDSGFPRANAPYGDSLHWTRLFDVLLLFIALPFSPLLGFGKALYFAGALISPLLHVLAAIALAWAVKPIMGRAAAYLAGGLTASQFGVLGVASVGHADHHLLFILISVLAFGFAIRSLIARKEKDQNANAFAAGAMIALGFWAGTETAVFLAICLATFGLPWLQREQGSAQRNFHLCLGLSLSLALVLLAERGVNGSLDVEYDRVSIIQLAMAVLLMAFFGAALALSAFLEKPPARFFAGLGGAAFIAVALRLLFPNILQGPMADVDPEVMFLINSVLEYAAIGDIWHFLIYAGGSIFALPFAIWRIKEEWPGPNRWPFVFCGILVLVYLVFAVNWVRWSLYIGVFLTVPLAGLIVRVDAKIAGRMSGLPRVLANTLAILLLTVGPLGAGIAGAHQQEKAKAGAKENQCPLKEMAEYLNLPLWMDRPRTIVASVNFGTELLYRTPHLVLATLHHRNSKGIMDSVKILGGGDEDLSLRLIGARKADLLLLCPGSSHDFYFTKQDGGQPLYNRLVEGKAPRWLKEVSLPPDLEKRFRLFQVIPSSSPG